MRLLKQRSEDQQIKQKRPEKGSADALYEALWKERLADEEAHFKRLHANLLDTLKRAGHEPITEVRLIPSDEDIPWVSVSIRCSKCDKRWGGRALSLFEKYLSPKRSCSG